MTISAFGGSVSYQYYLSKSREIGGLEMLPVGAVLGHMFPVQFQGIDITDIFGNDGFNEGYNLLPVGVSFRRGQEIEDGCA